MKRDLISLPRVLLMVLIGATPAVFANKHSNDKTTVKEAQQEVVNAAKAIQNYTVDKRNEAARKVSAALVSLDARIETMEARIDKNWEKMNKGARERARSTLTDLRKKRVRVAEKYGSLKSSSSEAWEHMKKGFSDSYKVLRSAWEKAEKEY